MERVTLGKAEKLKGELGSKGRKIKSCRNAVLHGWGESGLSNAERLKFGNRKGLKGS